MMLLEILIFLVQCAPSYWFSPDCVRSYVVYTHSRALGIRHEFTTCSSLSIYCRSRRSSLQMHANSQQSESLRNNRVRKYDKSIPSLNSIDCMHACSHWFQSELGAEYKHLYALAPYALARPFAAPVVVNGVCVCFVGHWHEHRQSNWLQAIHLYPHTNHMLWMELLPRCVPAHPRRMTRPLTHIREADVGKMPLISCVEHYASTDCYVHAYEQSMDYVPD